MQNHSFLSRCIDFSPNPPQRIAAALANQSSATFVISRALFALFASACLTPPPLGAGDASSASNATNAGSTNEASVPAVPYRWKNVAISGGGFVTGIVYSRVKQGLLYARTDTHAFHDYVWDFADSMMFLRGRLCYHYPDGKRGQNCGAASVVVAYGALASKRLKNCDLAGAFVELSERREA